MNEEIKISILIIVFLSIILGVGFLWGYSMEHEKIRNESLEKGFKYGYDKGWDECRDKWINSMIGLESDCFYETNEENTMVRYVCGNLTNGWKKI